VTCGITRRLVDHEVDVPFRYSHARATASDAPCSLLAARRRIYEPRARVHEAWGGCCAVRKCPRVRPWRRRPRFGSYGRLVAGCSARSCVGLRTDATLPQPPSSHATRRPKIGKPPSP